MGNKILVEAHVRTTKFNIDNNGFQVTSGPLASVDVSISNAELKVLLVKGDMLMHIEVLAKEK